MNPDLPNFTYKIDHLSDQLKLAANIARLNSNEARKLGKSLLALKSSENTQ